MDDIFAADLKTILHSKRANLYYLEHCRVLVNGGRVEYVTEEGEKSLYWNIPIANTTSILLGTGTSITQAAVRELAKAGVLIGFCGGAGTPLFASNAAEIDVEWLTSQSEYRPTEYLQQWVSFWFDAKKRAKAALLFQEVRIEQIKNEWLGAKMRREKNFSVSEEGLNSLLIHFAQKLTKASSAADILVEEAVMTKALYKLATQASNYGEFTRSKQGESFDSANRFLDHGNYLAYGLAATACWVLGLPHGLAVLHGKTRRGALVFDVADLIKDALVLPQAFIASVEGDSAQQFRTRIVTNFQQQAALDTMIDALKKVALECRNNDESPANAKDLE